MTTTLEVPTADNAEGIVPDYKRSQPERPVRASGVLRSEWVKLRSVRSSTMTLVAAAGTLLFVGASAAAFNGGLLAEPPDGDGGPGGGGSTSIVLAGLLLVPLIIGILGVMNITSEYTTGTIRSTMMFVPKRLPVLWSKAAVLTAVTLPTMIAATIVTFLAGMALLDAGNAGVATASLGDPGVLRAVLGSAAYLTGVALIGLAFGVLLRATPAALSALFALVFLVPGLGGFLLPVSVQDNVLLYLPSNAASSFTTVAPGPELLGVGAGAAVFALWVVVPMIAAAVAIKRRPV